MNHDLLHIQGKPYVLVPLHEYRMLSTAEGESEELPQAVLDAIFAKLDHPVKVLRKYRGLTQADLSDAAGLSRPYLAEIETGRKDGSLSAMKALAEALAVPAGLLV